jgi:hypothetical protein
MNMLNAVAVIRERLTKYRITGTADLWSTILEEIRERDSFDGSYADTILEIIRSFLGQFDDRTLIVLWRTTETGMADDSEDEYLFPDSIRMDLEMELLQEIANSAWDEAKALERPKP